MSGIRPMPAPASEPAERIATPPAPLASRMVAVGSRGLEARHALLQGSVTQRLIHLSRVPLLVARQASATAARWLSAEQAAGANPW